MAQLALTFLVSLLLGLRHATDPDHLVAIAAIVSREGPGGRATRIGLLWGLGHTVTILVVGGAIVALELQFAPRLGLSLEFAVAIMLIVLGVLNLRAASPVAHPVPAAQPFLVGVVHGLAGSGAATLLIIPLFPDPRWAALYLPVFGLGTIVGMVIATAAIAAPAARAARRLPQLERTIRVVAGVVSLAFGVWLAWRVGIADGLFAGHARWDPS